MHATWSQPKYPLQVSWEASPPLSPTDDQSRSHSAYTQPATDHKIYQHQPTAVDSTSSVMSSLSPSPISFNIPRHPVDDDALSSSTLYSRADSDARPAYYLQATKGRPTADDPPMSISASEQETEQSRRSSYPTPERTLRRTPRSRRLESPVQLTTDGESTRASRTIAWDSPTSPSASSSSSSAAASHASSAHGDSPDSAQLPPSSQTVHGPPRTLTWRRGAYPLQMAASSNGSRPLPTPPPSPTQQSQAEIRRNASVDETQHAKSTDTTAKPTEAARKPIGTSDKQPHRSAYPLQSPASVADLLQPQQPSVTENEKPQSVYTSPKTKAPENRKPSGPEPVRRRGYPLQAPASTRDLRQPHIESISEDEAFSGGKDEHEQQTPEIAHTASAVPTRRRAYPLQNPVSIGNFRQAQVQPTDELSTQLPRKDTPDTELDPFHHKAYPLQGPAGTNKSQHPSSNPIPNAANVDDNKNHLSEESTQKPEVVAPIPRPWRRSTYPTQPSEYESPSPRSMSPEPWHDNEEDHEKHETPPVLLPKNIRAVPQAQEKSTGRTIIVCLDGTGDKFDSDNSNIIHLVSALKKGDPRQLTYYQAGIGTYNAGGLSSGFAAAGDMAVGSGLGLHVRDAYHFLMHSYKEGDKICIFGFSRGAYTARCLAGMVHKVGLLPPRNLQQIPFAYEFYKNDTAAGWQQSAEFKATFSIDINIYFLGCFDSVASVGIIPRQLPLASTPTSKPRYFRHAMALDERRAKFKICRHQKVDWADIEGQEEHAKHGMHHHTHLTDEEYERIAHKQVFDTDVLEVWFAGAHADVGGGAVPNVERHKLAQIPLRWMIRQAFECDTGIIFQTKVLAEHGLDVHTLWPTYERLTAPMHGPPPSFLKRYQKELPPRSKRRSKLVPTDDKHHDGEPLLHLNDHTHEDWTPELVEDCYDALTPINDQLIQAPSWWILEVLPVEYKVPVAPGKVIIRKGMNWGQYRGVEDFRPKFHWTVAHRMQQLDYKLGVRTAKGIDWETVV